MINSFAQRPSSKQQHFQIVVRTRDVTRITINSSVNLFPSKCNAGIRLDSNLRLGGCKTGTSRTKIQHFGERLAVTRSTSPNDPLPPVGGVGFREARLPADLLSHSVAVRLLPTSVSVTCARSAAPCCWVANMTAPSEWKSGGWSFCARRRAWTPTVCRQLPSHQVYPP